MTWSVIWLWKLKFSIFVCLFVYLFGIFLHSYRGGVSASSNVKEFQTQSLLLLGWPAGVRPPQRRVTEIDHEDDHEDGPSAAQLELGEEEEAPTTEEDSAHQPLLGSWAEEPSSLCPETVREDLEHQVVTLTKKLADAEMAASLAAGRSRL